MKTKNYIKAGWLMDGTGGAAQKDVWIGTGKDLIHSVRAETPPGIQPDSMLDFSGHTIIPGLIDAHVHLVMSGTPDLETRENQLFAPYEKALPVMDGHVQDHLANGAIAIRDGGDWGAHALRYARNTQSPLIIKAAGRAWRAQGRYGKLVGRAPEDGQSLAQAIAQDQEKPHFIKVVGSGLNSLLKFGKQTSPQFSLEDLKEAVQAAREKGLDIMIHANGEIPVQVAIEAGCQSVEHGFFMGLDNLERMAQAGTVWVPTAVTMESYAKSLPQDDPRAEGAMKNLEHQVEQIALARELGVTLAVGTDAGSTGVDHGFAIRREMALFVRAGYSLGKALRAATLHGAQLLGLEGYGIIQPGKKACMVIIKGPPEKVLDHGQNPTAVIVDGKML